MNNKLQALDNALNSIAPELREDYINIRANKIIANYDTIKAYKELENEFITIKNLLSDSKAALEEGEKNFKNGGHVIDGKPLGKSFFEVSIKFLNYAINDISFYFNFSNQITELKKENMKLYNDYPELKADIKKLVCAKYKEFYMDSINSMYY